MSNTDQAFETAINKAAGFLDEIERLQAEAAAMREALEAAKQGFISIGWEAHPDNRNRRGRVGRIFEVAREGKLAIDSALTDAGREPLEAAKRSSIVIELEAMVTIMSKALEHSIVALEYAAQEFEQLSEDDDANMMERQAKENHGALSPSAGRELLATGA